MKIASGAVLVLTMAFAPGLVAAQTSFNASLDESQVMGGTGSSATGSADLALSVQGDTLAYAITLVGLDLDGNQTPGDPSDDVTNLHFHAAPPGVNGGVVFGLIAPGHDGDDIVIDAAAGTVTGIWENTDTNPLSAQLGNLLAGGLYLNVHTTAFGGGEIRGQVLGVDLTETPFTSNLNGAQAAAGMGTGSLATGSATLSLTADGAALSYAITLVGLDLDGNQTPVDPNDDVTNLHFHAAPPGVNGGVVFGLIAPGDDADDLVIDAATGTVTGIWENTDTNPLSAQLGNLLGGGLYLNVHTVAFGGGEIRGQVLAEKIFGNGFEQPPPPL